MSLVFLGHLESVRATDRRVTRQSYRTLALAQSLGALWVQEEIISLPQKMLTINATDLSGRQQRFM